jgi:trimethylamine--corrinoid protein Co-methyltransferase
MANYQTAFYDADLTDNDSFEQWRDAGEPDIRQRAHARWQAVLRDYEPPAIDPGVDEALKAFVARKKEAVPDAWH